MIRYDTNIADKVYTSLSSFERRMINQSSPIQIYEFRSSFVENLSEQNKEIKNGKREKEKLNVQRTIKF